MGGTAQATKAFEPKSSTERQRSKALADLTGQPRPSSSGNGKASQPKLTEVPPTVLFHRNEKVKSPLPSPTLRVKFEPSLMEGKEIKCEEGNFQFCRDKYGKWQRLENLNE